MRGVPRCIRNSCWNRCSTTSAPAATPSAWASRKAGLDTRHGTVLSLEDISVSFDGFKALNALNLYIGVGELRCIIGPNGAGKTTMMDVITGKTRPTPAALLATPST
jgi:ABC-type molybdenum transport system ATPase subunit/photorepair protein PhrA